MISNVNAAAHSDANEIKGLLVRQLIQPVRWEDSIRAMVADGFTQYYEVGPGRVLKGLMRRIDRSTTCENVEC